MSEELSKKMEEKQFELDQVHYTQLPFGEIVDLSDSFFRRDKNKWYRNIATIYIFRLFIAITIMEKSYHPDENQQGTEIAYKMAYGDQVDVLTTWEWLEYYGLRNTLYPFFLSIPMHILRYLKMDSNYAIITSPLYMNALLQLLGDYYGFILTERLVNKKCAMIFLSYCLFNSRITELFGRTMTNGPEASFAIIAFYYYSKL